jgi:hypothetical protein
MAAVSVKSIGLLLALRMKKIYQWVNTRFSFIH